MYPDQPPLLHQSCANESSEDKSSPLHSAMRLLLAPAYSTHHNSGTHPLVIPFYENTEKLFRKSVRLQTLQIQKQKPFLYQEKNLLSKPNPLLEALNSLQRPSPGSDRSSSCAASCSTSCCTSWLSNKSLKQNHYSNAPPGFNASLIFHHDLPIMTNLPIYQY